MNYLAHLHTAISFGRGGWAENHAGRDSSKLSFDDVGRRCFSKINLRMNTMTDLTNDSEKQNRLALIEQALKDKAPRMYEELVSCGQLERFLEGHDEEMMASYEKAKKQAWEETMTSYLSFSDASDSEASSPMG